MTFPIYFAILLLISQNFCSFAEEVEERTLKQRLSRRCLGPGNNYGWCTHIARCPLPDFKNDRLRFMDYFCIIDRLYIGVCCPDSFLFNTQVGTTLLGNNGALFPSNELSEGGQIANEVPLTPDKNNPQPVTSKPPPTGQRPPAEKLPTERKGCGLNDKPDELRVVGGKAADPKEWPWMAAILRYPSVQFCGGCLISDRHILTAAHCIFKYKPRELYVRLGEHDFSRLGETRPQNINVTEIIKHRDFDEVTYQNDIAVLKMSRSVSFNSYVWPACLPEAGPLFTSQIGIVTGWGSVEYGGTVSDVLMEVGVPVWENNACSEQYVQPIEDTNICAGGQAGKDSCQGDSGGPLLLQLQNRRWIVIGIVSWGIKCGEERPAVYTRVNRYLDWILRNTI